jgi:hypothetical protein
MEIQAASSVCPERVRPLRSVMVREARTGTRIPVSSKACWMAKRAALRFSVSKVVSGRSRSTPPSRSPRAASW